MYSAKTTVVLLAIVAFGSIALPAGETNVSAALKPTPQFEAPQTLTFPTLKPDPYPSLVAYDLDKDGALELITSGVQGRLVFSKRSAPGELKWIDSKPWLDAAGKQIDFHNW